MLNKSLNERKTSEKRQRTLKIKQRKDKQEPVITLRSMYFSIFYNNAQALELVLSQELNQNKVWTAKGV